MWRRRRFSHHGGGGTGGVGLKGPIQGAVAFIDLNNNAKLDIASEPYAFTDADGVYNIDSSASGTVVIITDGAADVVGGTLSINAVDTSSGSALTGVTSRRQRVRPLFHLHQQLFNHYQRRVSQLPM